MGYKKSKQEILVIMYLLCAMQEQVSIKSALVTVLLKYIYSTKPKVIKYSGSPSELATQACLPCVLSSFNATETVFPALC